jgi:hypothetical protein
MHLLDKTFENFSQLNKELKGKVHPVRGLEGPEGE